MLRTFDLVAEITGLVSDDVYVVVVIGSNLYTEFSRALPETTSCTTGE